MKIFKPIRKLLIIFMVVNLVLGNGDFFNRKVKRKKNRKLQDSGDAPPDFTLGPYRSLKFFLDLNNFNAKFPTSLINKKDIFINAMEKAARILESLLDIYDTDENAQLMDYLLTDNGIDYYNHTYFPIYEEKTDFNYAVFFNFMNLGVDNFPAKTIFLTSDKHSIPRMGIVTLNNQYDFESVTQDYLEKLFLHAFIHLIALHYSNDLIDEFLQYDGDKIYISSYNVVEYAKKYFNCDRIEGVEIELKNDEYHWSARTLLGELMTEFVYPEEQVLSKFTLSLFEDLKYLRLKHSYTGGLMRFGKHKGCEFLEKKCIGDESPEGESLQFENEFYYPLNYDLETFDKVSEKPSCSSGRLSKTIYKLIEYGSSIEEEYRYFSDTKFGGFPQAKYCPVARYDSETSFSIGSCSNSANIANTEMGESYSEKSFCALSSLKKTDDDSSANTYKAICFQMHCSSESLTIQFGEEDFFVCPREGGKIKGNENFSGYILCPDYNLICTSDNLCNDIFNCISLRGNEKDTFQYDNYENNIIKTTQVPFIYEDSAYEISIGWERAENGFCPQFCSQCNKDKICLKCKTHYNVEANTNKCVESIKNCDVYETEEKCKSCRSGILVEEGNKRVCEPSNFDISQYYRKDETDFYYYKKCSISNCYSCTSETVCTKCNQNYAIIGDDSSRCEDLSANLYYKDPEDNKYKLCSSKDPNCLKCTQSFDSFFNCIECNTGYNIFNDGVDDLCSPATSLQNDRSLFRNNNGIYYSCSNSLYHSVENCLNCQNKDTCEKCKTGFFLFNAYKLCLSNTQILQKIYFQNSTDNYFYLCSKAIRGCEKCEDGETCLECNILYDLDENNKCIPHALALEKYYKDSTTGKYVSCSKIENCEECVSESECTKCISGYEINNNLCSKIEKESQNENKDDNKWKSIAIAAIVLGTIGTVASIVAIIMILLKVIFKNHSKYKNNDAGTDSVNLKNNEEKNENDIIIQSNKRTIHNEARNNEG